MDISSITRPENLPFNVTYNLRNDINALLDALKRDDPNIDCYLDEVESSARELNENDDLRVRRYYVQGGWQYGDI